MTNRSVEQETQETEESYFYPHLNAEQNYLRAIYISVLKAGVLSELVA